MVREHNHMITKPYNSGTRTIHIQFRYNLSIVEEVAQTSTLTFPKFWLLELNVLLIQFCT